MKQRRVRGLVDVVEVSHPDEIRGLLADNQLDRQFEGGWPPLNWLLLRRVLRALSFQGERFPTLRPRRDAERSRRQDALWEQVTRRAAALTALDPDVRALAHWIQNPVDDAEPGILVQQAVGRLFVAEYTADAASWAAALILGGAPLEKGLTAFKSRLSGKVIQAKTLLAARVKGNLAGVHATGVAIHNLVKGFHRMRVLYRDHPQQSPEVAGAVSEQCLFAPSMILRQSTGNGSSSGCSYRKNTVFVLQLAAAQKQGAAMDLVFLDKMWSRCPAEAWVPAQFQAVWQCAAPGSTQPAAVCPQ